MVMSGADACGCVVGASTFSSLFTYNRENYFFDAQISQAYIFQWQNMRINRFNLYREDLRDLVALTYEITGLWLRRAEILQKLKAADEREEEHSSLPNADSSSGANRNEPVLPKRCARCKHAFQSSSAKV